MRLALIAITGTAFMIETPLRSDPLGVGHALQSDGPWIDVPDGYVVPLGLPTSQDIHAMADLDGDASVTTMQEAEMIALLTEVLGAAPVAQ